MTLLIVYLILGLISYAILDGGRFWEFLGFVLGGLIVIVFWPVFLGGYCARRIAATWINRG